MTHIDVLFTPADFEALARRDLGETACVVFDVLRATTSMLTALANGATAVMPVAEIAEALALRQRFPDVLLAGERDGVRIRASQTGGTEFDFGNSPREFTRDRVAGRTLASTTTNGTRALRASARAAYTLIGGFVNLSAVAGCLVGHPTRSLVIVCSGTFEETALEDVLAAGALLARLEGRLAVSAMSDAGMIARRLYEDYRHDLSAAIRQARNGRKLLSIPELKDDVPFCLGIDTVPFAARLEADGFVRKVPG